MTDTQERRNIPYSTTVTMCWRATCESPITGEELTAYGDTVDEARKRVDLQILRECEERGLTIEGRYDPRNEQAG